MSLQLRALSYSCTDLRTWPWAARKRTGKPAEIESREWHRLLKWLIQGHPLSLFQFNLFTSLRRLRCWAAGLSINISWVLLGSLSCHTPTTRSDKAGTWYQPTGVSAHLPSCTSHVCLYQPEHPAMAPSTSAGVWWWKRKLGIALLSEGNAGLWAAGKWMYENLTGFRLDFYVWYPAGFFSGYWRS